MNQKGHPCNPNIKRTDSEEVYEEFGIGKNQTRNPGWVHSNDVNRLKVADSYPTDISDEGENL